MTPPLSRDRARAILAAYGAEPRRWPDAERAALEAARRADPALAAERREAETLDAALTALPATASPAVNPLAIAAAARGAARPPARRAPRYAVRTAGLAAAAVVGFVIGWTGITGAGSGGDDRFAYLAGIEEDVL